VERRLEREVLNGQEYWFAAARPRPGRKNLMKAHLLPPFDEYLVGYQDRAAVLLSRHASRIQALLSPVVEVDGRIVGAWSRSLTKGNARLQVTPFTRWSPIVKDAVAHAAQRYGAFLRVPVALS
jgi:hypothetical protein